MAIKEPNPEEIRLAERVAEAIRARKFSATETLSMGFSLIDFTLRLNKEVNDAVHG